jgi:spore coat-associated protein N
VRLLSLRSLRIGGLVVVLLLAGLTVAYAATGSFPLTTTHNSAARAFSADAVGSLTIENSLEGQAILHATAMAPGQSRTGQVTITNSGNIAADFTLADSAVTNSPGPTAFSTVAQLVIQDISDPAVPITIYAGSLGGLTPIALGNFGVGDARTYRFTVTFPQGSPAVDNPLQGASSSVEYDWSATAPDGSTVTDTVPATTPGTTPAPPPVSTDTTPAAPVLGESTGPTPTPVPSPLTVTTSGPPPSVTPLKGPNVASNVWKVKITAAQRRHVEHGTVGFIVSCGRRCMIGFGGTIRIPPLRKLFKVSHVNFTIPAGQRMRVQVRLSPQIKAGIIRALKAHKRPTITAKVTARSGKLRARPHRSVRFIR